MEKIEQSEINKYIEKVDNIALGVVRGKSFNAVSLNIILDVMKEKNLKRSDIVRLTKLPKRTVYSIFESEERFLKASYENIIAILIALGIYGDVENKWQNLTEEYFLKDEEYKKELNKIIAQINPRDRYEFLLTQEDFDLVLSLLKKMKCRNENE